MEPVAAVDDDVEVQEDYVILGFETPEALPLFMRSVAMEGKVRKEAREQTACHLTVCAEILRGRS